MGIFSRKGNYLAMQELETPAEHIVQMPGEPYFGQGGLRGYSDGSLIFISPAGKIPLGNQIRSWDYGNPFLPGIIKNPKSKNLGLLTAGWIGISIPEEFAGAWIFWLESHHTKP